MNPLDLLQCFGAVFDRNASPQLLADCNLRLGIFASYWPLWVLLGTAVIALAGYLVRRYRKRPLSDAEMERYRPPTPPGLDGSRERADAAFEVRDQLDRLLEAADAIRQRLEADQPDQERQAQWTSDAEHFVGLNFQHFATDFRIAREPNQRLGGAHTPDVWVPLKRIAAQMEVLREIKRGLRDRPASQPTPDAIRAGADALREKAEAEGRANAIRRALERLKAEHEAALAKAPHLIWSAVSVNRHRQQGYEVRVECANVGPTLAQVQVGSRVTAVASQPETTGPTDGGGDEVLVSSGQVTEAMEFYEFSVPGVIHPVGQYAPFILRMRCPKASPLLDRTVYWRIVYKDDDDKLGFITDCSAIIDYTLGTFSVGAVVLDQSSREARHEKFKKDARMPGGDT